MTQTRMNFDAPKHDDHAIALHPQQMTNVEDIKRFLYAGNATITIVSKKSSIRFTYRVKSAPPMEEDKPGPVSHFVALMNGPDNEVNYAYLGHIYRRDGNYVHGRKSKIGPGADSAVAF